MLYELGVLTTTVTLSSVAAEIRAGTAAPMELLEMGIFLNAATATTLALGRPGNTPAGGTSQTATKPSGLNAVGGASLGGIILSGQTTAPTVPSAGNTLRQIALPAAIGNGIVFTWQPGELIVSPTTSDGLILWNLTAGSALRLYIRWRE